MNITGVMVQYYAGGSYCLPYIFRLTTMVSEGLNSVETKKECLSMSSMVT